MTTSGETLAELFATEWSAAAPAVADDIRSEQASEAGVWVDRRSSQTPVLLVGLSIDEHLDAAEAELARRGVSTLRLDADRWAAIPPVGPDLSSLFTSGWCRSIDLQHPLAHHGARRAVTADSIARLPARVRSYAAEQASQLVLGWLAGATVHGWVNEYWAVQRAEVKLRQLRAATRCGLSVPHTLVSSNPGAVTSFHQALRDGAVCKSLGDPFVWNDETGAGFLYTTPLTDEALDTLADTVPLPGLFQERLRPRTEYRVTVVGPQAFVVRVGGIRSPSSPPDAGEAVDWRRALPERVQAEVADLPTTLVDGVIRTVQELGLEFGAVDLLETDDDIFFLEVNPSGAYGWLERSLGLPITSAVCDLLVP